MTDLPQSFRQKLAEQVNLHTLTPVHEVRAKDGTVKVLLNLNDGKTVEAALMSYPTGRTVRQASVPVDWTGSEPVEPGTLVRL